MTWINTIDETDASGLLADVYDELTKRRGKPSNVMRAHSLHPEAMRAHLDLYETILFGASEFSRADRELLGVVISKTASTFDIFLYGSR